MLRTDNYEEAISWAQDLGIIGIVPQVWIPKSGFQYALKNSDGSVSFTRDGNPNFGLGIGPDPIIDPKWQRFALPKSLPKEKTLDFKLINRWKPYSIETKTIINIDSAGLYKGIEISSDGVKDFLDANAPESSVYPGNPETLFWAGIKIHEELVAVGCLGKWESGEFVISSITTKQELRNKGLGSAITKTIVNLANQRGIRRVSLAVNAKNEIAARVYEKIGFQNLGDFNTFENLDLL